MGFVGEMLRPKWASGETDLGKGENEVDLREKGRLDEDLGEWMVEIGGLGLRPVGEG